MRLPTAAGNKKRHFQSYKKGERVLRIVASKTEYIYTDFMADGGNLQFFRSEVATGFDYFLPFFRINFHIPDVGNEDDDGFDASRTLFVFVLLRRSIISQFHEFVPTGARTQIDARQRVELRTKTV